MNMTNSMNNLSDRKKIGAEILCSHMPEDVIKQTQFIERDGGLLLLAKADRMLMAFIPAEALEFIIELEDTARIEAHEWANIVSDNLNVSRPSTIDEILLKLKKEIEALGLEKVQVKSNPDLQESIILWASDNARLSLISISTGVLLAAFGDSAEWAELIKGIATTAYAIVGNEKKVNILKWRLSQIRKGIDTEGFVELTRYALTTIEGIQASTEQNTEQFDIVIQNTGLQPLLRNFFPGYIVVTCNSGKEKVQPRQVDDFARQISSLFPNPGGILASSTGFTSMSLVRIVDLYADQRILIVPLSLSDMEKAINNDHPMLEVVSNRVKQVVFWDFAQLAKEMTE